MQKRKLHKESCLIPNCIELSGNLITETLNPTPCPEEASGTHEAGSDASKGPKKYASRTSVLESGRIVRICINTAQRYLKTLHTSSREKHMISKAATKALEIFSTYMTVENVDEQITMLEQGITVLRERKLKNLRKEAPVANHLAESINEGQVAIKTTVSDEKPTKKA